MEETKISRESVQWLVLEGTAIVISIMLAFAIDAWWDERQETRKRTELATSLAIEFEANKELIDDHIERADSLIRQSNQFLELSSAEKSVPLEELRQSIVGAFYAIEFEPALSVYNAAVASGTLGLLDNPDLLAAIADFNRAWAAYEVLTRIANDITFRGSIWELRRDLGSLMVVAEPRDEYPSRFGLTDTEIRELYASPAVYALVENMSQLNFEIRAKLRTMKEAADKIAKELHNPQ